MYYITRSMNDTYENSMSRHRRCRRTISIPGAWKPNEIHHASWLCAQRWYVQGTRVRFRQWRLHSKLCVSVKGRPPVADKLTETKSSASLPEEMIITYCTTEFHYPTPIAFLQSTNYLRLSTTVVGFLPVDGK